MGKVDYYAYTVVGIKINYEQLDIDEYDGDDYSGNLVINDTTYKVQNFVGWDGGNDQLFIILHQWEASEDDDAVKSPLSIKKLYNLKKIFKQDLTTLSLWNDTFGMYSILVIYN